ncbi:MAG: cation diffusion facilitator family transporter [Dehalococcoidales bacterium]
MSSRKTRAAAISIISNSTLILLKIVAGLITGSISLIAEAIHSLMDLAAAIVAFFSVRISDKPADREHPFGHGKAENISAVVEAILIFVAAGIIIYQAVQRIIKGETLELLEIGIGIMAISIVVNIVVSRYLRKVSRETDSLALEADAAHLTTDVFTMAGVFVGLVIVRVAHLAGFNLNILDPIVAMLVSLLVIRTSFLLTTKSFGGLVDVKLPEEEETAIKAAITEHFGGEVVSFHRLRTRKAGSQRYIDLHLVMPRQISIEEAHRMCDHLEKDMRTRLRHTDVTIHVEPCNGQCDGCDLVTCDWKEPKD